MSRAYYAALHAAMRYQKARSIPDPPPLSGGRPYGRHERVIQGILTHFPSTAPQYERASDLNDLKASRGNADYQPSPAITQREAAFACLKAGTVVDAFTRFTT